MKEFEPIDLSAFPKEREEKLKSIYRYSMFERFQYRSNLWMHAHRMLWMAEELLPIAQKYLRIDPEKARALALVHDDAEMITGDVQAGAKARMTQAELAEIDGAEERAISELAANYPETVNGSSYEQLLQEALSKDSIEAKFNSYLDKLDGFCESMHEVLSGNMTLLPSLLFYTWTLSGFSAKYPELRPFLESKEHPLILSILSVSTGDMVDARSFDGLGKPFSSDSIKALSTRFPAYDHWKNMVIARAGAEGIEWLTKPASN